MTDSVKRDEKIISPLKIGKKEKAKQRKRDFCDDLSSKPESEA